MAFCCLFLLENIMREYDTTDIVELFDDENLYFVTGVIHDGKKLFVTLNNGKEHEIKFEDVVNRWSLNNK